MNRALQYLMNAMGIVFTVAGTLNLLFALQGKSVQFGMSLPLMQAGVWSALG